MLRRTIPGLLTASLISLACSASGPLPTDGGAEDRTADSVQCDISSCGSVLDASIDTAVCNGAIVGSCVYPTQDRMVCSNLVGTDVLQSQCEHLAGVFSPRPCDLPAGTPSTSCLDVASGGCIVSWFATSSAAADYCIGPTKVLRP